MLWPAHRGVSDCYEGHLCKPFFGIQEPNHVVFTTVRVVFAHVSVTYYDCVVHSVVNIGYDAVSIISCWVKLEN